MSTKYLKRSDQPAREWTGDHAGVGVDSTTGIVYVNNAGTRKELVDTDSAQTLSGKSFSGSWLPMRASVLVTAAELKAIRATPKTIIAAPGSGKMIEVFSITTFLDFNTTPYTETSDDLRFKYGDTSGTNATAAIDSTGFFDQSSDMVAVRFASTVTAAASTLDNKALILHNTGDGELGAGDSPLYVHVSYRIVDLTSVS